MAGTRRAIWNPCVFEAKPRYTEPILAPMRFRGDDTRKTAKWPSARASSRKRSNGFDQPLAIVRLSEKSASRRQALRRRIDFAGSDDDLDRRPTVADGRGELETVHGSGHVD